MVLKKADQQERPTKKASEILSMPTEYVSYFNMGSMEGRIHVAYLVKGSSDGLRLLEAGETHTGEFIKMPYQQTAVFYRSSKSFYLPQAPYSITLLQKAVALATDKAIVVVQPSTLAVATVPDFNAGGDRAASLRTRCEASKPLGMVQSHEGELLVVYADMGCYITKHGVPTRNSGYIRWETVATSLCFRPPYILLFSQSFIEIRHVDTGILVQVIEGQDIKHLQLDVEDRGPLLVAMRGSKGDKDGFSIKIVEFQETAPLTSTVLQHSEDIWDEWAY
jgi:hypothetical protein